MTEFTSCEECAGNKLKANCYRCIHNDSVKDYFKLEVKKIIDLSMVGSNIDMEFSNYLEDWFVDQLGSINNKSTHPYETTKCDSYRYCRIRQDYWHLWDGGECPLPEGLVVTLMYRNSDTTPAMYNYKWIPWNHKLNQNDIIAFKIIGAAYGWKYGWEK